MSAYILVVEDEHDISALVAYHLTRDAYRVRTAADGLEALRIIEREPPELVVLDLMLPGMSGLDLLRELRRRPALQFLPVILLTARKEEEDRIEGLRLGADDYVAKPFSPTELVLRVGAVLRRVRQTPPEAGQGTLLQAGPVRIDTGGAVAEVHGNAVELTRTEYRLLLLLIERRGRVQSRQQLLEELWETSADVTTRTVDMHIQRLRTKLGDAAGWIETVRGFGYRYRNESTPA
jgi:two-component system, OmpR family, phosphate regulon response regulator PhoB